MFPTGYFGLVTPNNGLELYDGDVRLIDRAGKQLEKFDGRNYLDYIAEHVEDWSYLKFPYYKKLGWPDGVYRVGPLGRCNASDMIETPLANEELKQFKALGNGKPVENTLYYHYARLIEALFAIERVGVLLDDPDILSTDILNTRKDFKGRGVGVIEAPRGTLFHDYTADEDGKLTQGQPDRLDRPQQLGDDGSGGQRGQDVHQARAARAGRDAQPRRSRRARARSVPVLLDARRRPDADDRRCG